MSGATDRVSASSSEEAPSGDVGELWVHGVSGAEASQMIDRPHARARWQGLQRLYAGGRGFRYDRSWQHSATNCLSSGE